MPMMLKPEMSSQLMPIEMMRRPTKPEADWVYNPHSGPGS